MVGVIALCYLVETVIDQPDWGQILFHAVVPQFSGTESVVLAAGILGATVMPHAIFLHSALTQGRIVVRDAPRMRRLFHFEIADIVIAMGIASFVNAAILIMAAATFHNTGFAHIASIEEAHRTLEPLLGRAAGWFFGLSLLVAGLSSATVGTSAGQVIMQGFLERHVPHLGAPRGHHGPVHHRHRPGPRPHQHTGPQSGGAQLRPALAPSCPWSCSPPTKHSWAN